MTTLLSGVANNNDKLIVALLDVLRDLTCRSMVTCRGIRTSVLTLDGLARCVAVPLIYVASEPCHMQGTGILGGDGHIFGVVVVVT